MARGVFGTGLATLEKRISKEIPRAVLSGAQNVAVERAEADLKQENANMPRQAGIDEDTKRQRARLGYSGTAPLVRSGDLQESGYVRVVVRVRGRSQGKVTYAIRRRGSDISDRVWSQEAQDAHVERMTEDAMQPKKYRTASRKKVRFNKDGHRMIQRDTLAGIMRAGVRGRGVPARDYTRHPKVWHDAISNRLIRKHLSHNLAAGGLRVLRSAGRFVVEVVEAAAEEAV